MVGLAGPVTPLAEPGVVREAILVAVGLAVEVWPLGTLELEVPAGEREVAPMRL